RVTGAFWPSVLGGYIFGFSPYLLGEALGHLVCIAVFPVPLDCADCAQAPRRGDFSGAFRSDFRDTAGHSIVMFGRSLRDRHAGRWILTVACPYFFSTATFASGSDT